EVALSAFFREIHLALAFPEPLSVGWGIFIFASSAADAALIVGMLAAFWRHRAAAGAAAGVLPRHQPVTDRDAAIKDIAFAFPKRLLRRHLFKVFQDAAFQMQHL